jgi:hypothetical protein
MRKRNKWSNTFTGQKTGKNEKGSLAWKKRKKKIKTDWRKGPMVKQSKISSVSAGITKNNKIPL